MSAESPTLVTLHVNYGRQAGDRIPELKAIAEWLADWAEREAFTSTGLTPAPALTGLPRTTFDKPGAGHYYDQIAWFTKGQKHRPALTLDVAGGGHLDTIP